MAADSKHRVATLAAWSIVVAIVVLGLKGVAWWLTGSVALYSDALESTVNVIAAGAALYAIRVSHKPADREHPFGHHKAEYISAVLEGVLIVVAALLIIVRASESLGNPKPLEAPMLGLAINASAAVLNLGWALLLLRVGRAARSPALVADGKHLMSDVFTSVGVLAGLLGALATGWLWLDPVLAIGVALNILWQGWKLVGQSVSGLMDQAVEIEETMRIRDIISQNAEGALEVHDLKTRIAGRATFIEFHLVVDAGMTVGRSHVICDRIEAALRAEIRSVRITIHVEPDDEAKLPKGTQSVPFA
ncbi:MAG: cation diffusion facilitator family transporter [Rhizobiaceae bacterium]